MQAEAYLKLHRPQDAVTTLTNGPNFDTDRCTKFFGPAGNAMLLVVRAQVDMAAGRLVCLLLENLFRSSLSSVVFVSLFKQ